MPALSAANPASVESAMLTAVARIIATTHTGTNAAKNCVDTGIFHQILQYRCNEQNDHKRR